ncbi:FAD-dependent oxidoreductase [Neobacillus mesonae]|uniref:NAD(P)/FAD-dependent oxidoreductase n=1 Tax=Neobacillus mesonae TaxID=1193713 RepID=UPI00203EDEB5|nr:FAD-dependent oxidoreductase [Neobacillus mesonae]MCM3569246.1 NAD(P)/FAD-dependent oxidoreductase [Neobacillus mesonae]
METDVLIIGAGPAGLAAAFETASRGLDVTVIDESLSLGGQLIQQTQNLSSLPSDLSPMRGFELAAHLIKQIEEYDIRYLLGHRVIGFYQDGTIGITDEVDVFPVKTKKMIVATGAAENAVAFPKWTLPGVLTIGAAQTLINRDFVKPGNDAVIVGSSDFAMDVALQLSEVGVQVKGIVEKSTGVLSRNTEKVKQVNKIGIPIYVDSSIVEARGMGAVEEIVIKQEDRVFTEKADLVCIDGGRSPILDIFYQLGTSFGFQKELGGWVPQYNKDFQTDCKDVFLAGNAAGVSTQGALVLTGRLAGMNVCEALGAVSKETAAVEKKGLWKELEIVETKYNLDIWHARNRHVDNFTHPVLKDQFIS